MVVGNTHLNRFIFGMKEIGIDDITKCIYAGGKPPSTDSGLWSHYNYYKNCFSDYEMPDHQDKCPCGKTIKNNCFVLYEGKLYVVGACCIKKFTKAKACVNCGVQHKRFKYNLCLECQKQERERRAARRCLCCECYSCNNQVFSKFCEQCNFKKCRFCGYKKNNKFKWCYLCNQKIQSGEKLTERPNNPNDPNFIDWKFEGYD